ncbi:MAG: NYN domain-containing protein [Clostridia bacterium]|nr:NYN domain-containing protein [Clostridia bacterium]
MKRNVIGILAHVDSGKTTLSEAMLYTTGKLRSLGRVDHRDSFLDNNQIERDRGITIFSKQAEMELDNSLFTLIDTPGHVDFSSETERTLQILDYAILVISGTDGVQSHTETLWKLLSGYGVPVFVFINKMDISHFDRAELIKNLQSRLGDGFVDFSAGDSEAFFEEMSMCSDEIMHEYLEEGKISGDAVCAAIAARKAFPCYFGSALKLDGVQEFLQGIDRYTLDKKRNNVFGAKVYKISEDDRGNRLTHMKITGGSLDVKTLLSGTTEDEPWEEKVNEVRIYSGEKYTMVQTAEQGMVCAVTGLTKTFAGQGLGNETDSASLSLEPVFSYKVRLPEGVSESSAYMTLKKLNQEETQLHVYWDAHLREIRMQLMGEVQIEVLRRIIAERFDLDVEFEQGGIIYKETILGTVEGVGHYEPLRHYAEVHLILEPGKPGSGLTFTSKCREDQLDINWQRLIMTHLKEKTHVGVLTGSPITDINIILAAGRAHQKHTDGGDFRQATYRAVRHGLRNSESVLLEPWYSFVIEVPAENIGRVMNDIGQMRGSFEPPETLGEMSVLKGSAPVETIRDYQREIISFTRGKGRMTCSLKGYEPCSVADEVIARMAYDCDGDLDNTADSVFCSHGASIVVKWDQVYDHMHIESVLRQRQEVTYVPQERTRKFDAASVSDDELMMIFERTFGKPKEKVYERKLKKASADSKPHHGKPRQLPDGPEYLLVDGYNIIFAWKSLADIARDNIDLARNQLINRLINYRAVRGCELIVVFDAYKVKNNPGYLEKVNGISVVYTKEAETADTYIEKVSHKLSRTNTVRVATSDGLEQLIILGNGALRVPASAFEKEMCAVEAAIEDFLKNQR